jgi:alkanesulfonate monooxygenase SsuD/methylene tetrahydromethanopterin reductase-like flavin-dependent oxidoreductase (luciferase family)
MSGGRVELGLGSGWFEAEHAAYGIPFPSVGERFDRLEEQLAIITGLWATPVGERFSYAGQHYRLANSPALPKPVQQPGPPVIVGGAGARRTPALAARYAAEFNMPFASVADTGAQFERVAAAVRDAGRDGIVLSAAQVLCCGKDEAELRRRAAAIGRDVAELRANGIAGTPAECVDRIGRFAELGATRLYLQTLDVDDLDHVDLVAAEVMPQVR